MEHKLLLIEDDAIMRVTLEDSLRAQGYTICAFEKGENAVAVFNKDKFSLVITDVRLPDMQGLEVLKAIKDKDEHVPVIVMTAFGTVKDAVEAMKVGAFDYITKPFSLEEFNLIVKRALEMKDLRDENARLKRDLSDCYSYPNIIGESDKMVAVQELARKVAQTDSTVLITGESGTGKELIATIIHYQSKRRNYPLVKVNCAALPENLIESELFGYEKGAFTGAVKTKPGRFERADRGTIFLDEIGELSPSIQTRLLRVLQDGSFERLGGTNTLSVDTRVIAATNRNIAEDMKTGRFREDLYYRVNVIPVHMPALRERKEDIPLLIEHFLDIYNCRFGKRVRLQPEAVFALMDYHFAGNVRELENIVERIVALSAGNLAGIESLPSHIVTKQKGPAPVNTLYEIASSAEKDHILKMLQVTRGNKTKAAELLGISRKSLWEKIRAYQIE
ncbi:MAG: sigma-54-dependent Fis family transcriptional regulator [Nitrospiraceae bacterium]|nr:MAG: sigma-54-dependent Fis family transcriptional regulator [Nitrospiraceae bacterium]